MTVDEPIHLEAYDENWVRLFEEERTSIVCRIGGSIAGIEHFGSTSVPGMTAKPIIDILIGVWDGDRTGGMIRQLTDLGYEDLGEAGIPGRLYLRKRGAQAYNVHIVLYLSDIWNNNIVIRNYLWANPGEAQRYGDFKCRIVQRGADTLLAYSDEKNEFVQNLLERAKTWAGVIGEEKV
ncbi:GrpB family protein [Paenibacillus sp. P26]|nr:GrpB family protein [Paenibacillus sp. P26]UUZ89346.1 GrpB family protein [Paenibacillus sp. P25]